MEKIKVYGGAKLNGTVDIGGAKNAVLPIMAACLLAEDGVTILHNVPVLSDVVTMVKILKCLNTVVEFDQESNKLKVWSTRRLNIEAKYEHVSEMRASVLVMGPLLARNGRARTVLPGGCNIGKRPIDFHLHGFEALGAQITETKSYIEAIAAVLVGNTIHLQFPSVGATQNIMLAAVKANGKTIIENAAKEPEVVDLGKFLNSMGAKVFGCGTDKICIKGVKNLHAVEYSIMQDRIEAGTFMIAAAMTGGNVLIRNAVYQHNCSLISKLEEAGVTVIEEADGIRVIGPDMIKALNLQTAPYPGFPTDLQAPMTAMLMYASGCSIIEETIFENRFQHLNEMKAMNGEVFVVGKRAIINGRQDIQGAQVYATDLRAAAALILIGLRARNVTEVNNLYYLDRGYNKFDKKLKNLGANIERVNNINTPK